MSLHRTEAAGFVIAHRSRPVWLGCPDGRENTALREYPLVFMRREDADKAFGAANPLLREDFEIAPVRITDAREVKRPAAEDPDRLLTVDDVSKLLNCHRTTVYRLHGKGTLQSVPGDLARFRASEVLRLIEKDKQPGSRERLGGGSGKGAEPPAIAAASLEKQRQNTARRLMEQAKMMKVVGPTLIRVIGKFVHDAEWRGPKYEVPADATVLEVLKMMQPLPGMGNYRIRHTLEKIVRLENGEKPGENVNPA
jgi:excisionase family DNA binding protein